MVPSRNHLTFCVALLCLCVCNVALASTGPLDHFIIEKPGGGAVGTQVDSVSFNVQYTAKDAAGNTVTSFNSLADYSFLVSLFGGGAFGGGGATVGPFVNGVFIDTLNFNTSNQFGTATPHVSTTSPAASGSTSFAIYPQMTLSISGPTHFNVGTTQTFWVDSSHDAGYHGTLHFTSSDPAAVLPADGVFSPGSGGESFSVVFNTPGLQSITVTDAGLASLTVTQSGIQVDGSTPAFSALAAPSIQFGTSPTILTGTLSFGAQIPSGNVSITLNSVTKPAAIDPTTGNFSASFDTSTLSVAGSPYTITYVYPGGVNFNAVSDTSKKLTVSKATPALVWADPADIVFGTALSGTQLNATASVPGTFVYVPASGSVLGIGTQTLSVTFNPTDPNYKSVGASVTIRVLNAPPVIVSAAAATPNPAVVGQAVAFSVTAGDADGDALSFSWDFGDGVSGAGANALHAYASLGTFTATVTITDTAGLSIAGSVDVLVSAAAIPIAGGGTLLDSNANGIPDEMESAAASVGINSVAAPSELTNVKLLIKLNFAKAGGDSIVLSGAFAPTPGLKLSQMPMVVDVGGVVATFVLNSKGKASIASGSVAVSLGRNASTAPKFTAKLGKGSFATALSAVGLVNADVKSKAVSVPVTVMFDGKLWAVSKTLQYKATKGKSGVAK